MASEMKNRKGRYTGTYYILTREWHTATNKTCDQYLNNYRSYSSGTSSYGKWASKHISLYNDYHSNKSAFASSPSRDTYALVAAGDVDALKQYQPDHLKRLAADPTHQWVAAANGRTAVLQFFCELGADLREGQFNALRGASIHNQLPVIQWLHGNGLLSEKHRTECLNLAAERGHIEIIKWLCANGASIHDIRKSSYPDPKTRALIADMKRERINNIVAAAIAESAAEKPASPVRRLLGRLGL